jgi:hypothetical protein
MLQLSLGYVAQADREREVAEDLRNRQSLLPPRDPRAPASAVLKQAVNWRRSSARVRSSGA